MYKKIILILLTLFASIGFAEVIPQNGNFTVDYRDIGLGEQGDFWIDRIYNSRSTNHGIFGWGWGSELDTKIISQTKNEIVVQEFGSGSKNTFKLTPRSSQNPTFVSDTFGHQTIKIQGDNLVRTFEEGRVHFFDKSGRLVKFVTQTRATVMVSYNGNSKWPSSLVDTKGAKLTFSYDSYGNLKEIMATPKIRAEYKISQDGDLLEIKDSFTNKYVYEYVKGRHLLSKIIYPDGKFKKITYSDREKGEKVTEVKNPNGSRTEIAYSNSGNSESVTTKEFNNDGKVESSAEYKYTFYDPDKTKIKTKQVLIGEIIEQSQFDEMGKLVEHRNHLGPTTFQYDSLNRIVARNNNFEKIKIEWLPGPKNLVKKITRTPAATNNTKWTEFKYTPFGVLSQVTTSQKQNISLKSDPLGRITQFTDNTSKRNIFVTYNSKNQVTKLKDSKLGDVALSYSGNIPKVVGSDADEERAQKVIAEFSQLTYIMNQGNIDLPQ